MERQWNRSYGCVVPLRLACWDVVSGRLTQKINPEAELFEYEKTIEVLCVRHTNKE
jgi:hypothetical protein